MHYLHINPIFFSSTILLQNSWFFPDFLQIFKFPDFFPAGIFFSPFSLFSLFFLSCGNPAMHMIFNCWVDRNNIHLPHICQAKTWSIELHLRGVDAHDTSCWIPSSTVPESATRAAASGPSKQCHSISIGLPRSSDMLFICRCSLWWSVFSCSSVAVVIRNALARLSSSV